jgi:hypothetical protein
MPPTFTLDAVKGFATHALAMLVRLVTVFDASDAFRRSQIANPMRIARSLNPQAISTNHFVLPPADKGSVMKPSMRALCCIIGLIFSASALEAETVATLDKRFAAPLSAGRGGAPAALSCCRSEHVARAPHPPPPSGTAGSPAPASAFRPRDSGNPRMYLAIPQKILKTSKPKRIIASL